MSSASRLSPYRIILYHRR